MKPASRKQPGPTPAQLVETAKAQTYAIVITFQPDLDVLERQFSALSREGVAVLVVDNHSPNQQEIIDLAGRSMFDVVTLPQNLGVAAAQNAGIDFVRDKCGQYVVLLDQDSVPEHGAFEHLLKGYLSLREQSDVVGAIGSSYILQGGEIGSSFVRFGWFRFTKVYCRDGSAGVHEVDFLISSGTLIPMTVLDEVGPMKVELFIDHVDTEWFLRAKSKGYRFFGSCFARMSHTLGERTYRVWFGRWRTVPIHRGFRYFFMFRNSLWLYKQHYAPSKWISADLIRLLYIFVFSGVFIRSGRHNLKWMVKGMRAGLYDVNDPRSVDVANMVKNSMPG